MNLVTRQREPSLPDPIQKRLIAGVVISLLIHASVLCLQFGIPGLGLPGAAAPEQNNLPPMQPLTVQINNLESFSNAVPPPVPPPTLPQPLPSPTPAPIVAPITGIQLVAPAIPTPPLIAPKPKLAKASIKKIAPRPKPTPPATPESPPEDPVRVIAQNEMHDDSFVVPLPSPEDPEHQATSEPKPKVAKLVEPMPVLDIASVPVLPQEPDSALKQIAEAAEAAEAAAVAKLAEDARQAQVARQEQRRQKQLKEEQARLQTEALVQVPKNEVIKKLQDDNRQQADAARIVDQKIAEQRQAEQQKIEQQAQQLAKQQVAEEQAKRTQELVQQSRQEEVKRQQQENQRLETVRRQEEEKQQKQIAELQARQQEALAQQQAQQRQKQLEEQANKLAAEQEAQKVAQQNVQREQDNKQRLDAQTSSKFEPRTLPAIGNNGDRIADRGGDRPGEKLGEGNGTKDGDRNGSGSDKGFVLPKNLFSSDLANKAIEQSRGLGLLRGKPPVPIFGDEDKSRRRAAGSEYSKDIPLRMYVESWRQKIERNGSLNYSQIAKDKARGYPVVSVILRSDGSIEDIVIISSSGRADLDEAVRRIVRVNARYASFPANVAEKYDTIEIRRVWNFEDALRITEELR